MTSRASCVFSTKGRLNLVDASSRDGRISSSLKNPYIEIYFPKISSKPLYRNLSLLFFSIFWDKIHFSLKMLGQFLFQKQKSQKKFALQPALFFTLLQSYTCQMSLLFTEITVLIYRCARGVAPSKGSLAFMSDKLFFSVLF